MSRSPLRTRRVPVPGADLHRTLPRVFTSGERDAAHFASRDERIVTEHRVARDELVRRHAHRKGGDEILVDDLPRGGDGLLKRRELARRMALALIPVME